MRMSVKEKGERDRDRETFFYILFVTCFPGSFG